MCRELCMYIGERDDVHADNVADRQSSIGEGGAVVAGEIILFWSLYLVDPSRLFTAWIYVEIPVRLPQRLRYLTQGLLCERYDQIQQIKFASFSDEKRELNCSATKPWFIQVKYPHIYLHPAIQRLRKRRLRSKSRELKQEEMEPETSSSSFWLLSNAWGKHQASKGVYNFWFWFVSDNESRLSKCLLILWTTCKLDRRRNFLPSNNAGNMSAWRTDWYEIEDYFYNLLLCY
jgi:hypothetical protein